MRATCTVCHGPPFLNLHRKLTSLSRAITTLVKAARPRTWVIAFNSDGKLRTWSDNIRFPNVEFKTLSDTGNFYKTARRESSRFFFSFLNLFILCMNALAACMPACQERASDLMYVVISCQVVAGNRTPDLWKSIQYSYYWTISPAPEVSVFKSSQWADFAGEYKIWLCWPRNYTWCVEIWESVTWKSTNVWEEHLQYGIWVNIWSGCPRALTYGEPHLQQNELCIWGAWPSLPWRPFIVLVCLRKVWSYQNPLSKPTSSVCHGL